MSCRRREFVEPIVHERNPLGVVGFLFSLSGVLCCVTAPIGLLLSLIALRGRPRGLAIAGVILGLIGTLALAGIAVSSEMEDRRDRVYLEQVDAERAEVVDSARREIDAIALRIIDREIERGAPLDADEIGREIAGGRDRWGSRIRYAEERGRDRRLLSAGPDRRFETPDDLSVPLGG
ncbi:MAG: DUF4190 domain-containing protein [Planctomycetota bacterium]